LIVPFGAWTFASKLNS
jgi:hypothetical protein